MKLTLWIQAGEHSTRPLRGVTTGSVLAHIDDLTAVLLEDPRTFALKVETGILASVERNQRTVLRGCL